MKKLLTKTLKEFKNLFSYTESLKWVAPVRYAQSIKAQINQTKEN